MQCVAAGDARNYYQAFAVFDRVAGAFPHLAWSGRYWAAMITASPVISPAGRSEIPASRPR